MRVEEVCSLLKSRLDQHDMMWSVGVEASLAEAAIATARELAARLRDDSILQAAIRRADEQSPYPDIIHWQPATVAAGNAGLALLCAHLDACFPTEGWDHAGHCHLLIAVGDAEKAGDIPAGLFSGWSGLAFATWSLSSQGARYQKLLAALDNKLLPRLGPFARRLSEQRQDIAIGHYDVVSGLAGIGAYLLCRRSEPEIARLLDAVLKVLIHLTQEEDGTPYWHTPRHLIPDEGWAAGCPNGYLNCGLAHGIPGPLALMALATAYGHAPPGIEDALTRAADWLLAHRVDDGWGVNWPSAFPVGGSPASLRPARAAWCYGVPGVARALWLTGRALGVSRYCEVAMEAMQAVYARPLAARALNSPTFCHGRAGLLQVTLRFAHDTGESSFREQASALLAQLLSLYDAELLLGYRDHHSEHYFMDQPALLTGVAGIILVLLAASTSVAPVWDRFFLLS